jgi:hypothetical protein
LFLFYFIFSSSPVQAPMKKFSSLKQAGDGNGKLIVYSSPDFQGDEHTFKDNVPKVGECPWKGKTIGSVIIQGNPWLFYPEEVSKVCVM